MTNFRELVADLTPVFALCAAALPKIETGVQLPLVGYAILVEQAADLHLVVEQIFNN